MFVRQLADASDLSRDPLRERQWTRRFFLVWFALFGFRLLMLALSPLELSGDEAYYWEWGRRLDWGYFSKPPLIGWMMGLFAWIGNDSTVGIRLGALVFGSAALVPLFLAGRSMFNAEAGFWAALALAFTPGNAAASFFFTIDAPLLFSWCLGLWAIWTLFNAKAWSWSAGLGLMLALALGLLSKQMMLVFPLLAIVHLILEPRHRHWLARRGWWLCVCGGLLALLPPIVWNWQHDWITVSHTAGTNMQSAAVSWSRQLGRFGEFVGLQMVLLGPILYVMVLWLLTRTVKAWGRLQAAERMLWIFSAPALLVFFAVALKIRALANWPAVYYPAGFLLLGAWVAGHLSYAPMKGFGSGLFRTGLGLGMVMTLVAHLALFLIPQTHFELKEQAPLRRLQGWSDFANQVSDLEAASFGAEPHFLLVAGHRYHASTLAFYHPAHPTVFVWNDSGHPESQYDLWPGPENAEENVALVIVPEGKGADALEAPASLRAFFEHLEPLPSLHTTLSANDGRTYAVFRGVRKRDNTEAAR